jgi:hypothetical protein
MREIRDLLSIRVSRILGREIRDLFPIRVRSNIYVLYFLVCNHLYISLIE